MKTDVFTTGLSAPEGPVALSDGTTEMSVRPQSVTLECREFMRHKRNRPRYPVGFWY